MGWVGGWVGWVGGVCLGVGGGSAHQVVRRWGVAEAGRGGAGTRSPPTPTPYKHTHRCRPPLQGAGGPGTSELGANALVVAFRVLKAIDTRIKDDAGARAGVLGMRARVRAVLGRRVHAPSSCPLFVQTPPAHPIAHAPAHSPATDPTRPHHPARAEERKRRMEFEIVREERPPTMRVIPSPAAQAAQEQDPFLP